MKDREKIKRCPFCGGNNIKPDYIETYSLDSSYWVFGCEDCRTYQDFEPSGSYGQITEADWEEAITQWNNRPEESRLSSRVEELEKEKREAVECIESALNCRDIDMDWNTEEAYTIMINFLNSIKEGE